jgi:hypothetical protein
MCRLIAVDFAGSHKLFMSRKLSSMGIAGVEPCHLSTSSFGEEKRCNHPGLYQVEQAKREDVVWKAGKT